MPEGPEVRRTVDYLKKFINKTLLKITFNYGRYIKHGPFKNYQKMLNDLPLKIKKIDCKGKFIYFIFENNQVLFNTLGMSGKWQTKEAKHNNVSFYFKNVKSTLYFNDYRNFGTFKYQTLDELDIKLKELGPDILMEPKNVDEFKKRLEKKRNNTKIATALLDQKVAAGCGNYLRAEVLYQVKISPFTEIKNLSENNIINIWQTLVKIAWIFYDYKKGIKRNILSKNDKLIKMYVNKDYDDYYYYHNFMVYFQETDPKGNPVIREKLGTRTIHYVLHK